MIVAHVFCFDVFVVDIDDYVFTVRAVATERYCFHREFFSLCKIVH